MVVAFEKRWGRWEDLLFRPGDESLEVRLEAVGTMSAGFLD
jgi:hypothetical protein